MEFTKTTSFKFVTNVWFGWHLIYLIAECLEFLLLALGWYSPLALSHLPASQSSAGALFISMIIPSLFMLVGIHAVATKKKWGLIIIVLYIILEASTTPLGLLDIVNFFCLLYLLLNYKKIFSIPKSS